MAEQNWMTRRWGKYEVEFREQWPPLPTWVAEVGDSQIFLRRRFGGLPNWKATCSLSPVEGNATTAQEALDALLRALRGNVEALQSVVRGEWKV